MVLLSCKDKSSKLIYRKKRLSRNLKSDKWDEQKLQKQYLALYGKVKLGYCDRMRHRGFTEKIRGRAFQYLAQVHDWSEEKIGLGYWLIEVCALYKNGSKNPLVQFQFG
ncbi:MAG: hypothetical protein C4291_06180 [Candidatus Dadabacteria bacterium]